MHDRVPTHLVGDRWRAIRLIARGGMGAVYEAQHHLTGERVALKMMLPHVTIDPAAVERFKREVSFAAAIGHESIPRVIDAGADAQTGGLYLAMELLDGETLAARMVRLRDPWDATRIIVEVLEPLVAAHAKGIVHRDLKPMNVFVSRHPDGRERVCLLDLGIARQEGDASNATVTRSVVGSPGYMAPEQAKTARGATPAADVWAVGAMLYQAWSGELPFRGETHTAIIVAACTEPHVPLSRVAPQTPPSIVELVDRCLAKTPAGRPRDASELRAALRPLLGSPVAARPVTVFPRRRGRLGLVLGTLTVLLVLAVGLASVGVLLLRRRLRTRSASLTPIASDAGAAAPGVVIPPPSVDPDPPRLVGPLSGSFVTSQQPTLRFSPAAGATATRLELCLDRACTRIAGYVDTSSNRATPSAALPCGIVYWRARSMVGAQSGVRPSATWSMMVPARSAPRGTVVGMLSDFDGDGLADVATGIPGARGGQGLVRVFASTRASGRIARQQDAPTPPVTLVALGTTLAHAGDIDGDGYTDLVAGAPASKAGAGVVAVSYGAPSLLRPGYALMEGVGGFGLAVAGAGDMDADGYADVAIASTGDGARGTVHIARGSPRGPQAAPDAFTGGLGAGERFGASVDAAGDVNGDGSADLVVGAPGAVGGNGRMYLIYGQATWASAGELTVASYDAPEPGGAFGSVVAGVGDLDGDGHADVAVGAPSLDVVYFLWGSPAGLVGTQVARLRSPVGAGVRFGTAIAGIGDVDRDGFGEVAIGAWGNERERGGVYLFEGTPQGISNVRGHAVPPAAATTARFGWSLAGPGDVDGDGYADLVVGAPFAFDRAGRAYVVFGAATGFAERPFDELRPLEPGAHEFGTSL